MSTFGSQWLDRTKRKPLLAALEKIKEGIMEGVNVCFIVLFSLAGYLAYMVLFQFWVESELMVFGLLSLLMGHWITFVAKICIKSSALTSRFYPCSGWDIKEASILNHTVFMRFTHFNVSVSRELMENAQNEFCPPVRMQCLCHLA